MPRLRDLGRCPGVLPAGALNSITDVDGVAVGQVTRIADPATRTGVTAVLPHPGNPYLERVPAGLAVANGHGKLAGATQLLELGELETPIVLVNTLSVGRAVEAVIDWTLHRPGCERVRSVNALVGETNDSPLNDIRTRGISQQDVLRAIETAGTGSVDLGAVGAGTGTMAFGYKAGIGSSSRVTDAGYTVGVLVQANFGGILELDGIRVARSAGDAGPRSADTENQGSIMIVVATDAPLSDRNLTRLAWRAIAGLARTGSSFENGSGDYAIAFSVNQDCRRSARSRRPRRTADLPNNSMSPLFRAAIEATEEAIYDSLLMAEPMQSTDPATGRTIVAESAVADIMRALERAGS